MTLIKTFHNNKLLTHDKSWIQILVAEMNKLFSPRHTEGRVGGRSRGRFVWSKEKINNAFIFLIGVLELHTDRFSNISAIDWCRFDQNPPLSLGDIAIH